MLNSTKASVARVPYLASKQGLPARPVAPPAAVVRLATVPRSVTARALLLPQQVQSTDPIDTIISAVLSWLEPKKDLTSSMDETMLDLHTNEDDEGHSGWGHSHIADRLATECSMSQEFDI